MDVLELALRNPKSAPVGNSTHDRQSVHSNSAAVGNLIPAGWSCHPNGAVRTTINLDDDVATEVAKLRRLRGIEVSAAVNELARAGFKARSEYQYEHMSHDMGALVDLSDTDAVLELLDEADRV
jgi:hypothetical protein